jgi:hypothetical protein
MRVLFIILFAIASAPAGAAGDWCVFAEYKKKFPECDEFTNIVDYNNCVVRAIAEKCERTNAEVFNLLKKQMMGD